MEVDPGSDDVEADRETRAQKLKLKFSEEMSNSVHK